MLPYCIRLLYDALSAPNNPASHPLSGPGVAIPLPRCKCSKRGFSGMPYSTARTKPETPLRTSTAPSPRVAAHLLSGVSPSGTILRSFPGRNPAYRKCCQTPSPTANVLSGVSGSRRATGRYLAQKPRLASVKPCGCGAGGWPAQRNPSRRTRLGLGSGIDQTRALRARPLP